MTINHDESQSLKSFEDYKHELAKALEDHKAELRILEEKRRLESENLLATSQAVFDYAQIAIRTVIIANGAGATAILTYVGEAHKSPGSIDVRALGISAGVFGIGVAAGFLATIFAYFSQFQLVRGAVLAGSKIIPGTRWERMAAIFCVFIGLAAFLSGLVLAIWSYTFQ